MKLPACLRFAPAIALTAMALPVFAQNNNNPEGLKEFRATRVETGPVLDGRLDDAVWQQSDMIDDFH
jgi:hypothetical protein